MYRSTHAASPGSRPPSPPPSNPLPHSLSRPPSSSSPLPSHPPPHHPIPSSHSSSIPHPHIPLAPHPSFTLHNRHTHLSKFLSSPLGTSLLLNKLRAGSIFLKHGQRGSPHYRYLWLSERLDVLQYSELKRRDKVTGSVDVASLVRVDEGHASATFARSRGSDAGKCFSIVGEGRTLDLECLSEEEREMWVIAFSFLIEFTRRGGMAGAGHSVDVSSIPPSLSLVSALELLCEQNQTLAQAKLPPAHENQQGGRVEEERKEMYGGTPERRSGEVVVGDGSAVVYTIQQGSPPLPLHVSPTSSIRVSQINRFEVIDIIDESLPAPPSHHVATSLPLSSPSLSLPSGAFEDPRLMRLARDLEQYKEDNKRLLLSHAKKMMRLQQEIDQLAEMNRKLRAMKQKLDTQQRRSPVGRDRAGSDREWRDSDDSEEL